jgi:hypothetical protein
MKVELGLIINNIEKIIRTSTRLYKYIVTTVYFILNFKGIYLSLYNLVIQREVGVLELGGFALAVSAASLYLSYRTYEDNKKTKKLETRPIFYIDSTFENRDERYIEFNISALKSRDIRNVDLTWIGDNNAKLRFNKILKNQETNTWEYKAILDLEKYYFRKRSEWKINNRMQYSI